MPPAARKKKRREPLTRERVLEAALRIADQEGLEELSMRRLAAELKVEAMSLYNHVPNKQALLLGVLDLALTDVELPPATISDWRGWVREWMLRARAAFKAHPALFPVLVTQPSLGVNALKLIDGLFGRLGAAGFDTAAQINAWEVLKAFLLGTMVQQQIATSDESIAQALACCPSLTAALPTMACCDLGAQFAYGLDVILRGMELAR